MSFAESMLQEASVIEALAESGVHVEVEGEWDDSDEDPPLHFANTPVTPKSNGMSLGTWCLYQFCTGKP